MKKRKVTASIVSRADYQQAFRERALRAAAKANERTFVLREGKQIALATGLMQSNGRINGTVHLYTLSSAAFARRVASMLQEIAKQQQQLKPDEMMQATLATIEQADRHDHGLDDVHAAEDDAFIESLGEPDPVKAQQQFEQKQLELYEPASV